MQFHLESLGFGWKIINEPAFKDLKFTLDNIMKQQTAMGIGVSVRKAQILSITDEDYLWSLGLLGTSSPEVLLNTVVFIVGKGFALCAGKEHHNLCAPGFYSQIQFVQDDLGDILIRYTEKIGFKTNKGGIKHRKIEPKVMDLYLISNAECCPVRIIIKYLSMLPKDRKCKAFYLLLSR